MGLAVFWDKESDRGRLSAMGAGGHEVQFETQSIGAVTFVSRVSPVFSDRRGILRRGKKMVAWCGVLRNEQRLRRHYSGPSGTGDLLLHLMDSGNVARVLNDLRGRICLFFFSEEKGEPRLVVARDKLGLTPVMMFRGDNTFAASTNPEMLREHLSLNERVNRERLLDYLIGSSGAGRDDFVAPFERLLPGEFANVTLGSRVDIKGYFTRFDPRREWNSFQTEAHQLREGVERLIQLFGADQAAYMMSGGLDSTALVGAHSRLMDSQTSDRTKISAMSLVSGERPFNDESDLISIMRTQFPIEHAELELTSELQLTEDRILEQTGGFGPQWHPGTVYESRLLESITKRFGVRRVLGGVGGDHLFAGQFGSAAEWHLREGNYNALFREFRARWDGLESGYRLGRWLVGCSVPNTVKREIKKLLSGAENRPPWLNPELWMTFRGRSADVVELTESGRPGVPREKTWRWEAFVRECRRKEQVSDTRYVFPYFDSKFVKRFSGLPPNYRYRNGRNKAILRAAFSGILPEPILSADKRFWIGNLLEAALSRNSRSIETMFSHSHLAALGLIKPAKFLEVFRAFTARVNPEKPELGIGPIWRTISAEKWLTEFNG